MVVADVDHQSASQAPPTWSRRSPFSGSVVGAQLPARMGTKGIASKAFGIMLEIRPDDVRQEIEDVLTDYDGDREKAAAELGMSSPSLRKLMALANVSEEWNHPPPIEIPRGKLEVLLRKHRGNRQAVARELDVEPGVVWRNIDRHGLRALYPSSHHPF